MGKKTRFQWEADSGLPRDVPPPPRDRSKRKREADAVDRLVAELLAVRPSDRKRLPVGDDVLDGLVELERLRKAGATGGLRRQKLYVAGRLRQVDLEALREAMPRPGEASERDRALARAERLRRKLLADDAALEALLEAHPHGDRQVLRQRIRQARKEQAAGKPGKAHKALFADLRALLGID